jgi:hypothetical protein
MVVSIVLREYAKFTAVLRPERTDDLKPSVLPLIGRRFTFKAMWIIEDGETYAGDWACCIQDPPDRRIDWVWVPSRDLVEIDAVDPHCGSS